MIWKVWGIVCILFFVFNEVISINVFDADDVDGNLSAENTDDDINDGKEKIGAPLREQDRFLPIANVAKIMKKAVPELGKVCFNFYFVIN